MTPSGFVEEAKALYDFGKRISNPTKIRSRKGPKNVCEKTKKKKSKKKVEESRSRRAKAEVLYQESDEFREARAHLNHQDKFERQKRRRQKRKLK